MKNQKGITLIALIVTIIVLIILAGISINLLFGDNGIISKTKDAGRVTSVEKAREEVGLAWTDVTTKYYFDGGLATGKTLNEYYTKANLDASLSNGSLVEDPVFEDGKFEVKYETEGTVYTFYIDGSGNMQHSGTDNGNNNTPTGKTANDVKGEPSTYYGKTVNYTVNGVSNWQVFYADNNNIFLIFADYLPNNKIPSADVKNNTAGTYELYWSSIPSAQSVNNDLKSSFMWDGWTNYSSNSNAKCVSTLLNTENWDDFVNPAYADYAIGSPTVEMFCASWNERYPSEKLYCNNTNSSGYHIGTSSSPTSPYIVYQTMQTKQGYSNPLYYPHASIEDQPYGESYGYWLASPSSNNGVSMIDVSCRGYIGSSNCQNRGFGIRPIVRLKKGISLGEGTNGYDYDLAINQSGSIPTETGALRTAQNVNNYGKVVTNYTAKDYAWRLFYEDSNNYYLICNSEIQQDIWSGRWAEHRGIYWYDDYGLDESATGASVSIQGQVLNPLAGGLTSNNLGVNSSGLNLFTTSNTNHNIQAVKIVCDIDRWSEYKVGKASWAMGGPSAELYAASFNATHGMDHLKFTIGTYGYYWEKTGEYSIYDNNGIYYSSRMYILASPYGGGDWPSREICDAMGFQPIQTPQVFRPIVCISKSTGFVCEFAD